VLLQVCETAGILVQLRPPTLSEVDQWEGALVSSTSRLALPVDRLTIPAAAGAAAAGEERVVEFGESPVTRRIASLVQDAIAANSTPVFELE
jgi:branched-subunit amino acid aminotransferase/4-amino-4-deoxychorismate lyase